MWQADAQDQTEVSSLPLRDYLAAATICALFILLIASSYYKPYSAVQIDPFNEKPSVTQEVHVLVSGHVKYPGSHWIPIGSTMGDVLRRAEPLENADLRRYKRETLIKKPRKIHIRALPTITIHVDGAIDLPISLTLPQGTRLMDIIEKLHFTESADIDKLRRKRRLKDGEKIWVSIKT